MIVKRTELARSSEYNHSDHFVDVNKMVSMLKGAGKDVQDMI